MAKQSIANPVVSLGLDSSGLRNGLANAMGDVKSAGSKLNQSISSSIGSPLSMAGMAASSLLGPIGIVAGAVASTVGSLISTVVDTAISAAKVGFVTLAAFGYLALQSLMSREEFLSERSGLPMLLGSDAGYSGVFARLSQTWEDTLADMMVALDRAFDFRGWIEYARGALAAVSAIMEAILGPLKEVNKNPEHLEEMFRLGGEMMIDVFEQGAEIFANVYNSFVDLIKMIDGLKPAFARMIAAMSNPVETAMVGGLGDRGRAMFRNLMVQFGVVDAQGNQLPGAAAGAKLPPEFAAVLGGTARALFAGMNFAPDKTNAKDAENLSNKLIPMMEKMQTARLGSSITSDSTAIVEAVTRASVAGPGQDLQQRVALAAEETVRQQKATNALQEKILAAYNNAGGDARFKILAAP